MFLICENMTEVDTKHLRFCGLWGFVVVVLAFQLTFTESLIKKKKQKKKKEKKRQRTGGSYAVEGFLLSREVSYLQLLTSLGG